MWLKELLQNFLYEIYTFHPAVGEVTGQAFWRTPFNSICSAKQLTEYIVLQIERLEDKDRRHIKGEGARSQKVSQYFVDRL